MARLRYAKTPAQVAKAAEGNPEFLQSRVRSIRVVYETDARIAAAVLPRPLEPAARPEVGVTFSHVAMQIRPDFTFEIGSTVFGVKARYEGVEGLYPITMPMTAEAAVVDGRETYGEPKKLAEIKFAREGDDVSAQVTRHGMTYLAVRGKLAGARAPREFTEHAYCFKAFPSCEKGRSFDGDPLLVRLEWHHKHDVVIDVDGELVLGDSMIDPVADVPLRRLVSMEYEEGTTRSGGKVLRSVPGEWLLPFLHQRFDDISGDWIDL
jgi:acetoacetate decarboxylase